MDKKPIAMPVVPIRGMLSATLQDMQVTLTGDVRARWNDLAPDGLSKFGTLPAATKAENND